MIKTKKSVVLKYVSPDGSEHDTQEAAEVHHLSAVIAPIFTPIIINDDQSATKMIELISYAMIHNKSVIGPLLHVPKKRVVRTAAERAEIKRIAQEVAAKKKADTKAKRAAQKTA